MNTQPEPEAERHPLNPIRVETALSRYPIHRLAKKGGISIELREEDERGETTLQWRVTYNSGFGQPGPLAYKLDTLIINRKIQEARRPIPRIICLGSLKEMAERLELGGDTNCVKKGSGKMPVPSSSRRSDTSFPMEPYKRWKPTSPVTA